MREVVAEDEVLEEEGEGGDGVVEFVAEGDTEEVGRERG